jgi:dTMP kinase
LIAIKHAKSANIGLFVSVDGPNGVGKSTLIEAIAQIITGKGFRLHLTKEVTKTTLGEFIRDVHKEYRGKTLALLLAADRQNHLEQDILPALQSHDIVITDRYVDSSLVFQRLDGVELSFLLKINSDFLRPNLSIVVTASADVIASRMATRKSFDRFEQSFGCEEEVRLFKEAASFMEENGFNVRRFDNGNVSVANAAEELSGEILHLIRERANSM